MWTVKRAMPVALGASKGFFGLLGMVSGEYMGEWTGNMLVMCDMHIVSWRLSTHACDIPIGKNLCNTLEIALTNYINTRTNN